MKKIIAMLLAAVMVLGMLAGCGSQEAPATQAPATEAPKAEAPATQAPKEENRALTVMMSSGDFGAGLITQALETVAASANITLEFEVIPDDQMITVANTKLSTGNAGDIIVHNFGLTDISAKDLAPLDGPWVGKITDTTYPLCIDEGGNVLKAPLGGESNMGFIYNKKVLEEAGVQIGRASCRERV